MRTFNNMKGAPLAALKRRFRRADIDRMLKLGSREVALNIALMERNRMRGSAPWRLAKMCLRRCRANETRKYGAPAA